MFDIIGKIVVFLLCFIVLVGFIVAVVFFGMSLFAGVVAS